mgnify:CR=1 FL=1
MRSINWKKQSIIVYWLFSFLYWEVLAHAGMYDQFQSSFRYALGISGAISLIIALLIMFLL